MRLGFSVRVFGANVPSYDARRYPERPSLSTSLVYLRDILTYLGAHQMHMYRMHTRLAPAPEGGEAAALREVEACTLDLEAVGALARGLGVRLSFHPFSIVVLNAVNEEQVARSRAHLATLAAILDAMGLDDEAVIVLHVGGVYDGLERACERFIARYEALPEASRRRLALEHDDRRFSFHDVWGLHRACGVRLVFDTLHHQVLNPERIPWTEALALALSTWPHGVRPKVHVSSPRTELRPTAAGARVKMPTWTEHSDLVNPFAFIAFLRQTAGLRPFDVMLEAKARDLAVLKLRADLQRFAPEWVGRVE
ncbi:MAG TPA: UV damage endonuclease UvsE [Chloroflexi bacterium]|jgi:UV DNA damage endonuclease|nr:UV damage endonuclease UvsE [Chloroflexota bacterium]